MNEDEIKKLLEENIALTKDVKILAAKTENYIKWIRISDILKILLIILPLVAAWIYLPDIISTFTSGYGDLLPAELFK